MAPVRLVLADSHPLILMGLQLLFSSLSEFVVVESCRSAETAVLAVRKHRPDILLLELKLRDQDAADVIRALRKDNATTRVVILTNQGDDNAALQAVRLGARGMVVKELAPESLIQCLRTVHAGGEWLEKSSSSLALETLLPPDVDSRRRVHRLTKREKQLVSLVATGMNNRSIAEQLKISEGTVKIHLHRIYQKCQVKGRVALTLLAQKAGLC